MAEEKRSGAARSGFVIDTSSLEAGLRDLVSRVEPKATGQGLFAAANELLHDAIYVPPQAPKDVGDLRGSARTTQAELTDRGAEVVCGFNIVYAAKWHEVPLGKKINWTTDKGAKSPGPKYLESKLLAYRDKYMRIVANFLKAALGEA